jgi:putative peptidoglycan lipid II flippase
VAERDSVAHSAFRVSLGSLLSLLGRLVSQVIIAAMFGAGAHMDAFMTALVVPAYFEAVLLAGLSFVLIPAFVRERESGQEADAWSLAGTFFWMTCGILLTIAVFGTFYAGRIIAISAPGLDPAKSNLAAHMLAVMMAALPLHAAASLTTGIQNARNRFFGPAVAPALGALGNVAVVLALYPTTGAIALAWGHLTAAVVACGITVLPILRRLWSRLLPLSDARVLNLLGLVTPFILFGLLTRSTFVVERFFASSLPDGQLSCLGYAYKLAYIVLALVGVGIAGAIFPAMARAYERDGERGLVERAEYGFRLSLALALPALAVLSALAIPLVTVVFERGVFDRTATLSVSRLVPIVMTGSVLFAMLGNVLGRTFYVVRDTWTSPATAFFMSLIYIFLAKFLVDRWGCFGLACAEPLKGGAVVAVLTVFLFRRLRLFNTMGLLQDSLKYSVAAAATYCVARLMATATAPLPVIAQLSISLLVAGLIYITILIRFDRVIAVSVLEMAGLERVSRRLGILPLSRGGVERVNVPE